MQTYGQKIRFAILFIAVSAMACVLYAETGFTATGTASHEVRMTVDPTVLPPVIPPAEDELPAESPTPDEAPLEEVELPEIEHRTPLPKPPGKTVEAPVTQPAPTKAEQPQPAPAPKAEAKPAPKPAPAAKPKPVPATQNEQIITPTPPGVGKGTVTKVDIESLKDGFVMTVHCTRPVGDTSYINLRNPRRLVVDLREPWFLKAGYRIKAQGGVVKQVITGTHPDRLRLVIYFNKSFKGNLTPEFVRTGNKLIVSATLP